MFLSKNKTRIGVPIFLERRKKMRRTWIGLIGLVLAVVFICQSAKTAEANDFSIFISIGDRPGIRLGYATRGGHPGYYPQRGSSYPGGYTGRQPSYHTGQMYRPQGGYSHPGSYRNCQPVRYTGQMYRPQGNSRPGSYRPNQYGYGSRQSYSATSIVFGHGQQGYGQRSGQRYGGYR